MSEARSSLRLALAAAVLTYALLAGCYTVKNFDLGWQLAAGRYIADTGKIPRQDVFSYTAAGREWIYPAGSQLLLYLAYRLGGYPVLTLLGMLSCAATVLVVLLASSEKLLAAPSLPALCLATLAVPATAMRTGARADMFTTVLFAVVQGLLWRFHRQLPARLYLIPFLFVIWANLHQGFIFGLLLFVPLFAGELARPDRSWTRVRSIAGWGLASAAAVLLNPWGWRLYASLWGVRRDMAFQRGFIGEASGVPLGWWRLQELVRFDDPDAGFWVLAALALAGIVASLLSAKLSPIRSRFPVLAVADIVAGLLRRDLFAALVLAGSLLAGMRYVRAQALVVIAAAILLPGVFRRVRPLGVAAVSRPVRLAASLLLALVIVVRSAGLVTDRYYIARADTATFGLGLSWWFPERALDFIRREKPPGQLYHDYNLGGWVMWRLWPEYRVYIDGRAAPFTPGVFLEQQALLAGTPGSPEWRAFLDRRGINTVLVSLARFGGYRVSPAALCASPEFRLVYLDEISGIWVRNRPENRAWLERFASEQRACEGRRLPLVYPPAAGRAARHNFLTNAAQLSHALGRDDAALELYREAEKLFPEDAALRLSVGHIRQAQGRFHEAGREYRNSLALRDSPQAWHSLGLLEAGQGRYREAAEAFARAAERSVLAHESYRMLGEAHLGMNQPGKALDAFARARASSRYQGEAAALGQPFLAAVAEGEQRARAMLSAK